MTTFDALTLLALLAFVVAGSLFWADHTLRLFDAWMAL